MFCRGLWSSTLGFPRRSTTSLVYVVFLSIKLEVGTEQYIYYSGCLLSDTFTVLL